MSESLGYWGGFAIGLIIGWGCCQPKIKWWQGAALRAQKRATAEWQRAERIQHAWHVDDLQRRAPKE